MAESSDTGGQFALVRNDSPTVDDVLNREDVVKRIVHIVKTVKPPFTLGVYGGWGSGKSSIMLAVRERLETDGFFGPEGRIYAGPVPGPPRGVPVPVGDGATLHDDEVRDYRGTVWFNAWEHQADTDPAVAMLQEARRLLRPSWLNRWRMRKWFRILRDAIGPALEGVGPRVGASVAALRMSAEKVNRDLFAVQEDQVRKKEAFREIVSLLARRNRKGRIVFFVDDLDRCDDKVAVRLLDDIKTYLDQTKCVFVIGVNAAKLRDQQDGDGQPKVADQGSASERLGEDRLAKIISYPFYVPPLEEEQYGQFLVETLRERFEKPDSTWSSVAQQVADLMKAVLADRSASVRETVRLSNVFTVNYELSRAALTEEGQLPWFQPEVVAVLSAVQAFHPTVHEWLCTNQDWPDDEDRRLPEQRRASAVGKKVLYLFRGEGQLSDGAEVRYRELGVTILRQAREGVTLRANEGETDDQTAGRLGLYLTLGARAEQVLDRPEGSRWTTEHRARPNLTVGEVQKWILTRTLDGSGKGWDATELPVVKIGAHWWWVLGVEKKNIQGEGPKQCALLLAENFVDIREYDSETPDFRFWGNSEHANLKGTLWSDSTVRSWLRGEFKDTLPKDVSERIVRVMTQTPTDWAGDNKSTDWDQQVRGDQRGKAEKGDSLSDETIFLLSWEEIFRQGGIYDLKKLDRDARASDGVVGFWWLRSPGYGPIHAWAVLPSSLADPGDRGGRGLWAGSRAGVRPAFWLNLGS
ncbi:MAG: KAP family NTPase [Micrococcales bacterium]|nr:KAP family NTPase [Micrococcales bacterium]